MLSFNSVFSARERRMLGVLVFACGCKALLSQASTAPYAPPAFGHYQPILDRMPFGALPADFNTATVDPATVKNEAQVKAEQEALAKKINMSAVNVTPDGTTAIGFTDLSVNPPVSYYLLVGDERNGWTVLCADYDEGTATIEKDGVQLPLQLGKGLVEAKPSPAPGSALAALKVKLSSDLTGVPKSDSVSKAVAVPPPAVDTPLRSYAERLRERATQKTQEQLATEARMRAQFENLARETAAREIQRREDAAAQAAEEQALLQQQEMQQPQEQQQPEQQ